MHEIRQEAVHGFSQGGATQASTNAADAPNSPTSSTTQTHSSSSTKKPKKAPATKPWSQHDKLPCDELHEDDGIDPRVFFRKSQPRSNDRKLWQLCHQVKQLLSLLVAEHEDGVFWEVREITPAPNVSRLQVTLMFHPTNSKQAPSQTRLKQQLQKWEREWREELAHALHRKRVPTLVLEVMVYQEGGEA